MQPDKKAQSVVEFDSNAIDFDYLKSHGFQYKLEPVPGLVKIWHGELTQDERDDLKAQDWVRAVGIAEGIDFGD